MTKKEAKKLLYVINAYIEDKRIKTHDDFKILCSVVNYHIKSTEVETKEELKKLIPIIQAFINGEIIEVLFLSDGIWSCIEEPDFSLPAENYRIKPQPQTKSPDYNMLNDVISIKDICIKIIKCNDKSQDALSLMNLANTFDGIYYNMQNLIEQVIELKCKLKNYESLKNNIDNAINDFNQNNK